MTETNRIDRITHNAIPLFRKKTVPFDRFVSRVDVGWLSGGYTVYIVSVWCICIESCFTSLLVFATNMLSWIYTVSPLV